MDPTEDLVPQTLALATEVNNCKGRFIFCALFDTGATPVLIRRGAIPKGTEIRVTPSHNHIQTTMGTMQVREYVIISNIAFPEFLPTRKVKAMKALIFDDNNVKYDIIIGRKQMHKMGIQIDLDKSTVTWIDRTINFHTSEWTKNATAMRKILAVEPYRVHAAEDMAAEILPANQVSTKL